jgi:hypothetical protein
MNLSGGLTSVGAIIGVFYGVSQRKSFWTTAGFTILFAVGGAAVGTAIKQFSND